MQHAHWSVQFKTVDDDARIIEGTASTSNPDRIGDVLEPKGARFTLPLPLLWQHRPDHPIGHVLSAKATDTGIAIRAQLAKGVLPYIDEAWALIKAGLVRGLSVGFKGIEGSPIHGTGGIRFKRWDWFELSAVTVPMNAQASIALIKSLDAPYLAGSGTGLRIGFTVPAVVGVSKDRPMNYSERLTAAQAERTQKTTELEALMALDTLTDEQTTDRDTLTSEIDRLNATVKSLNVLERGSLLTAQPIGARPAAPVPSTPSAVALSVQEPKLPPGIGYARMVLCKAAAEWAVMRGQMLTPVQVAKQWYPSSERLQLAIKAAVAPAVTTDSTWAGALVYNETIADFVEYLNPRTIVGQFGQGSIPSLNRVPFNMRQLVETAAMTANWVGEAKPKPVTKGGYTAQTLGFTKVAAITINSEEILKFANQPGISAETAMRDGLTKAVVKKIDTSFIDPALAAVPGVNPASITHGVTLGTSAGNDADAVRADILTLFSGFLGDNIDPRGIVLIMPPAVALSVSLMTNAVGTAEFPTLSMNGGTIKGLPVIVSNYAALPGYGNLVIAVVAPEINLADDGQVSVDLSREASLEMSDAPTQSGTTGVSLVSLWQNNLVAFRAERFINWAPARAGVVAVIQSVNWGGVGSPS